MICFCCPCVKSLLHYPPSAAAAGALVSKKAFPDTARVASGADLVTESDLVSSNPRTACGHGLSMVTLADKTARSVHETMSWAVEPARSEQHREVSQPDIFQRFLSVRVLSSVSRLTHG